MGQRTNLARGKHYQFSRVPDYRLTIDEADLTDLTDGRLSQREDEKIWFERHAVAWQGDSGVHIVLDLEQVQKVGEVAPRILGGAEQNSLLFPRRVEVAVSEDSLQKVLDTIMRTAQTGQIGDGKIFVAELADTIRIRTGETGNDAL